MTVLSNCWCPPITSGEPLWSLGEEVGALKQPQVAVKALSAHKRKAAVLCFYRYCIVVYDSIFGGRGPQNFYYKLL